MKKSDLKVITSTKRLLTYIFKITEKCPVKYRYSFIIRMHNYILDSIEALYMANSLDLKDSKRYDYQNMAKTKLRLLDYICEASKDCACIDMHQYDHISKEIYSILNMLDAWMNSDASRKEELV